MYANYGDFSRVRRDRPKHYTGVLYQQGRVSLDADSNEQESIDHQLREAELRDIIGPYGAPAGAPGFQISVANNAISIGAGRYFVQGLLCDNPNAVQYLDQNLLINPDNTDAELLSQLLSGEIGAIRVYLQVWERMVTVLDDSSLCEPALGLADTTARRQTVWRVVAEPQPVQAASAQPNIQDYPKIQGLVTMLRNQSPALLAALSDTGAAASSSASGSGSGASSKARLGEAVRKAAVSSAPKSKTKRPQAASGVRRTVSRGTPIPKVKQTLSQNRTLSQAPTLSQNRTLTQKAAINPILPQILSSYFNLTPSATSAVAAPSGPNCCSDMYDTVATPPTPGTLTVTLAGGSDDCSCEPTPAAGYRGLENQLYRVEIHNGGDETLATFKWSRENGSVVAAVTDISGNVVSTNTLGPDANLGFAALDWVELSDDTYQFGQTPNRPGQLYQVQTPSQPNLTITMSQPVTGIDTTRNARVRRWDQSGPSAGAEGISLSAGTTLTLENGIQIMFSAGNYNPGDYWLIPARTAQGQIEWPPPGSDGNAAQPPWHSTVYQAPLACIHWNSKAGRLYVEDCRNIFWPLAPNAMHIAKINWINDVSMPLDKFLIEGLTVMFDRPPSSPIDGGNFIVTLEAPNLAGNQTRGSPSGGGVSRSILILDGIITLMPDQRTYQWLFTATTLTSVFLSALPGSVNNAAQAGFPYRVRVKLFGHSIFTTTASSKQLYLDGQAFGAMSSSNTINLNMPSGGALRASDFDSWFYLSPRLVIDSIAVTPAQVPVAQEMPDAARIDITFNSPPPVGTPINVWANPIAQATDAQYLKIPSPVLASTSNTNGNIVSVYLNVQENPGNITGNSLPIPYTIAASLAQTTGNGDVTPANFSVVGSPPGIQ